jgi:hypothetical protein
VDVAFWQCENSVAQRAITSPTPTFSVSQSKGSDNYTFLLSQIPALGAEHSLYCRFAIPNPSAAGQSAVALTDGTTNEQTKFLMNTSTCRLTVIDGGSGVGSITGSTVIANTLFSAAARIKLNDCAQSTNGAAVGTDTSVTLPTVTEVRFANAGTNGVATNIFRITKLVVVTDRGWNDATLVTKSAS